MTILSQAEPDCDATVIVPAHDEAAGIGAMLKHLCAALAAIPERRFEVVVACNACSDDTAAIARATAPEAQVLEIADRGKAGAINRALECARGRSVLVIDADIAIDGMTLAALAAELDQPGVLAVSPAVRFVLDGCSPLVRAYVRAFSHHRYLASGVGGAGVYGLSRAGRGMLGPFPAIAADDHYVRSMVPQPGQRRVAQGLDGEPVCVSVMPPATLAALLRVELRSRSGDRAVHALLPQRAWRTRQKGWLLNALRAGPIDLLAFVAVKLIVRLLLVFSRREHGEGWRPERG